MGNKVLELTAGKPFSQVIRIPDARNIWSTIVQLEVRAQLRDGESTQSKLITNLHDFMTYEFNDNDELVITWKMSGADTRALYSKQWGTGKKGYFNIIVSDTGTDDDRALVVPLVTLKAKDTTTTSGGLT